MFRAAILFWVLVVSSPVLAQTFKMEQGAFFEVKIRPVLTQEMFEFLSQVNRRQ